MPTVRQALRMVRIDLDTAKNNPNRSPWINGRVSRKAREACDDAGIEIGNKPAVGGGYLNGIGVWWHVDGQHIRTSPFRPL